MSFEGEGDGIFGGEDAFDRAGGEEEVDILAPEDMEGEKAADASKEKDGSGKKEGYADPSKAVDPSKRVTTRYMTKYERARLLGTRALQLR